VLVSGLFMEQKNFYACFYYCIPPGTVTLVSLLCAQDVFVYIVFLKELVIEEGEDSIM
jgi:hypothetical protein